MKGVAAGVVTTDSTKNGLRSNVLITGDLNATVTNQEPGGSGEHLGPWMAELGLADPVGPCGRKSNDIIATFYKKIEPIGRIDHALTAFQTAHIINYSISTSIAWVGVTDHRPLAVGINMPNDEALHKKCEQKLKGSTKLPTARQLKAPMDIKEFQGRTMEHLKSLGPTPKTQKGLADQLEAISGQAAEVVDALLPRVRKVSHLQHWTPAFAALTAQRVLILKVWTVLTDVTRRGTPINRHDVKKNQKGM